MLNTQFCQDTSWSFTDLSTSHTQYLTHGYHRYPAKFIPQLVSRLIHEYTGPKYIICDPFGGCGTTLVEAILTDRLGFGYDINPLAVMITRAKTCAIDPSLLLERFTRLCHDMEKGLPSLSANGKRSLNIDRLLYWFGYANLEQLLSLRLRIEHEGNIAIRRFFNCALSHILKNCSYWLSKSIKPQKDPTKVPASPYIAFREHASHMITRNEAFYNLLEEQHLSGIFTGMHEADARRLPLPNNCVDLMITSPPYSISYDYSDIHQLSMLLLGFTDSVSKYRRRLIGSRYGNKCIRNSVLSDLKAVTIVKQLGNVDRQLAKALYHYFVDMSQVYLEIGRILKKDGRACIVIGDTILRDTLVPNTEIAIDQLSKAGLLLERVIERPISSKILSPYRDGNNGRFTSSGNTKARHIYNREYIIVMKKQSKSHIGVIKNV